MKHIRVALLLLAGLLLSSFPISPPAGAATRPTAVTLTFTSSGTVNSQAYLPVRPHMGVVVTVKATQAGTFQLQRQDSAGAWNALGVARAAVADTEDQHVIDYPIAGYLRVQYINTSAASGTALVEFIDKAAL